MVIVIIYQYLESVQLFSGVFKTLSNIYDEVFFSKIVNG